MASQATKKLQVTLPDSRKLAYVLTRASPEAPIVLLSNTFGADLTLWDPFVAYLKDAGYSTIAYDHIGHGSSDPLQDPSKTSLDLMADDVASLLQQLHIDRLAAWIGVSLGGAIGAAFVENHPGIVDKLTICGTPMVSPIKLGVMPREALQAQIEAARQSQSVLAMVDRMSQRWVADAAWLKDHPKVQDRIKQSISGTTVSAFEGVMLCIVGDESYDLTLRFPGAAKGCRQFQVLYGSHDGVLIEGREALVQSLETCQKQAGKTPDVRTKVIEHAGHVPYLDAFEDFCRVIEDFLKAS